MQKYIPHIDGLRAIAVISVLLFHLDIAFIGGGFIGVDIFFVISGFLITRIIAKELEENRFSLSRFYARRIKRIFPALFVMLVLTSAMAVVMLPPVPFTYHLESLRMAAGQISNFFFVKELDYFDSNAQQAALLHTWSLGVEEQFYVLWPFLLIFARRFSTKQKAIGLSLLGFVSLALSEYLVHVDAMQAFYMLHTRAWELAIGGIIVLGVIPPLKKAQSLISMIGLTLIIIGVLFLEAQPFPGIRAMLPCLGAALIIYSGLGEKQSFVHRALSLKPVVFIGLISYSLYLWHWPLIIFTKSLFGSELTPLAQILLALASFICAIISYYLVEKPTRKINWSSWKIIILGLLIMVSLIIGSNVLKKYRQANWRVTVTLEEEITRPNKWVKTCSAEGGAYSDECIIGDNKDSYEILLVGDSHASHFIPTVTDWAKEQGMSVRLFMRGACKTWLINDYERIKNGKRDSYCEKLSDDFYDLIEKTPSIRYIFLAQRKPSGSERERAALERIKETGKKVIFLGAVAEFPEEPNHCYISRNLLITKILPQKDQGTSCREYDPAFIDEFLHNVDNGFRPMLKDMDIRYFDPRSVMKTPYDANGNFMYMDNNHLNIYGAQFLSPHLSEFMNNQ